MPLIIKVSVSRKLTQDFNSRGWCLDIQSELDSRTLDNTNQLADSTNYLFQLATDLLDQQVRQASEEKQSNGNGGSKHSPAANNRNQNGNGNKPGHNRLNGNGSYSGPSNGGDSANSLRNNKSSGTNERRNERPITAAQTNAITKMAERFDTNGDAIAREDFNCNLSELTIRQASELIDRLKKGLEAPQGVGAGQ